MSKTVATRRIPWGDRAVEWAAVAADAGPEEVRNAVWSYRLDGITYFGFPFDPTEAGPTTTQRALNWLNRYHLIVRREHLATEPIAPVR